MLENTLWLVHIQLLQRSVDGVTITPSDKISILGFTLYSKLQPQAYLKELADGVLYRKHVVGRLSAHLPPHVLKMFARATVLGKIRTYLHLSLKVRLSESDPLTVWGKKLQVIVNDVARVVAKKRRPSSGPAKEGGPCRHQCHGLLKLGNACLEGKQAREPAP